MTQLPRLALACLLLVSGPALAQVHGPIAGGSSARLSGLISGAFLINPVAASIPLMPPASLDSALAAPGPTANQRTPKTDYVSTKASKIVAIQLLNAIGNNVDLKNGGSFVMSYDMETFDLKKSVAALQSNDGPNDQSKTTVGADKVISLLKTDESLNFSLGKDAAYLAARLDEMQRTGRLNAVIAHTVNAAETVVFNVNIYTNDGWALFLKLVRAKSPKNI